VPGFLTELPKCELHVHLEGTLEPAMAAAFAARHGVTGVTSSRPSTYEGLAAFLTDYYAALAGLRTEADFADLSAAYLDVARRQGVVYAEMFFDPQAHTARGVPFETVVGGIHRGQEVALARGGPESALVMCLLRDESVASAEETLELSLPYRERGWILGVGLDSDERGNPPRKFAGVFARARTAGYRLTMHCDPRQPDAVANLWECLDVIGVERVDHGIDCLADDALTAEIARRGLGLTLCPLSNLRLYGDAMAATLRELMDRGVLVTVNSDDPAYFGGYIADNFEALQDWAHLSRTQMASLARNGFVAAWLTPKRRRAHLSHLDEYLRG
jgi:adenosine deaminase